MITLNENIYLATFDIVRAETVSCVEAVPQHSRHVHLTSSS
jgi:hypothetical protein